MQNDFQTWKTNIITTIIITNFFGFTIIYYQACYIILKIHISSKLSIRVAKEYHNVNDNYNNSELELETHTQTKQNQKKKRKKKHNMSE